VSPATSTFLDLLRVLAALIVFVNHDVQFWNPAVWSVTNPLAHSAVVVFFVLSGYVIAYSTLARNQSPRKYVVARLSRLYSVVVPALLLTALLYLVGKALNPDFYLVHSRGAEIPRYVLTALFMQSAWTLSASPPSNLPFWSLSYEFWYYTLFGIVVFVKSRWVMTLAVLGVILVVTPNILLLLPCWLLGVAAYVFRDRVAIPIRAARFAFAVAVAVTLLVFGFLPELPFHLGHPGLWYSALFITDWIAAAAVGSMLVLFHATRYGAPPARAAAAIRFGADHTFSLYLYHYPLLVFANAVLPLGQNLLRQTLCLGGILGVILLLSTFTEARRDAWRRMFERRMASVEAALSRRRQQRA